MDLCEKCRSDTLVDNYLDLLMARDLHIALKAEQLASASVEGLDLVLVNLQWGKNDASLSLHVAPKTFSSAGFQTTDFLNYLGFLRQACPFLAGGDGYCRFIPEGFDLQGFAKAFVEGYRKMESAERHLEACGFRLKQPEGWGYFFGKPPARRRILYYTGDGHTASKSKLMKNSEDEYFYFAFSWVESSNEKGWTTHYRPKHPPLSSEMLAVVNLLELKTFNECPMFDFEPCYWKFVSYEQHGRTFFNSNTEVAHRWFDAHATDFSRGIEQLLAAQTAVNPYGMYFLPIEQGGDERAKREISRRVDKPAQAIRKTAGGYEYDVALSFAGTERHLAEALAKIVRDGGFAVFYDDFYPEQLWGKDLVVFFDEIYRKNSRYCVIFISREYAARMWTNHERRSAQARALQEKGKEYILPIQIDNSELPGMPPTIGHLSIGQFTIEKIAKILIKKLSA